MRSIILNILTLLSLSFYLLGQTNNTSKYSFSNVDRGFIENKGQVIDQNHKPNSEVKYLLNRTGINLQLRETGFSYDTYTDKKASKEKQQLSKHDKTKTTDGIVRYYDRVDIHLMGCNPNAEMVAEEKSTGYLNYFTTGTPKTGASHIYSYQKVTYKDIYPHIDLVFFTSESQTEELGQKIGTSGFEYNFIVHPGGNTSDIKLTYSGANKITLVNNRLVINVTSGDFTENIPTSYYKNIKQSVNVNYTSLGNNTFGFFVNSQISNSNSDLIIDPTPSLEWGTYYGGTGLDCGQGITLDFSGNVYITGYTGSSSAIATAGAYQTTIGLGYDVFVAKFNSTGTALLWGTYYGGTNDNYGYGITIDATDNVYITGYTNSNTGIATPGAYQTVFGGFYDAFVAKFNSTGTALLWGTYYGGTNQDEGYGIALDSSDNVCITGNTQSIAAIATAGTHQTSFGGVRDAFVAKFNSAGTSLLWGTYYGGIDDDEGNGIALDASNNVYVTGVTGSTNAIASAGVYQPALGGSSDAFIAKFNSTGTILLWGTYYGGTGWDAGNDITMDNSGDVYIIGNTESSTGIATAGAYQTTFGGFEDAFVAKFNSTGTTLVWGTYYGGPYYDQGNGIVLDASDNIYVTGNTESSTGIATPRAYQTTFGGGEDAYVAKFNSTGASLLWGTYYGGAGYDEGNGIAVNAKENIYITGSTQSNSAIATAGAYQTIYGNNEDAFIAKFDSIEILSTKIGAIINVACNGSTTGSASVIVSGGISPYTYSWSPTGGTNASATGLAVGPYTIIVTDAVGESATAMATITEPPILSTTTTVINEVSCYGTKNGSISANPSGGTLPYTYFWSGGGTNVIDTGLTAGIYTITITDNNGCIGTALATITQPSPIINTPTVITNVNCYGESNGTLSNNSSGGIPPYTYSWSNGGTNITNTGLSAGIYTVTVTDNNGCMKSTAITITQPDPLSIIAIVVNNERCYGANNGTASATSSGGRPPYSYSWSSGGTDATYTGLSAGEYSVIVTDSNGCTTSTSITINQLIPTVSINVCCDSIITPGQGIQLISSGGITYSWTPTIGLNCDTCPNPIATPAQTTTYTVTIATDSGCIFAKTITIDVACGDLFVPNVFNPGEVGRNDILYVRGPCISSMDFIVFDRWGNKIFESQNQDKGWDGTYNNQPMNMGTYVWYLKATMRDGTTIERNGNVTLVR